MPQIPSPNQGKQFKQIKDNKGYYYDFSTQQQVVEYVPYDPLKPQNGVYAVSKTVEVPINPEIIDLSTGQSNAKYWKPDLIYGECEHCFTITSVGKREAECLKCSYPMVFNAATDYTEIDGQGYLHFKEKKYIVKYL